MKRHIIKDGALDAYVFHEDLASGPDADGNQKRLVAYVFSAQKAIYFRVHYKDTDGKPIGVDMPTLAAAIEFYNEL